MNILLVHNLFQRCGVLRTRNQNQPSESKVLISILTLRDLPVIKRKLLLESKNQLINPQHPNMVIAHKCSNHSKMTTQNTVYLVILVKALLHNQEFITLQFNPKSSHQILIRQNHIPPVSISSQHRHTTVNPNKNTDSQRCKLNLH